MPDENEEDGDDAGDSHPGHDTVVDDSYVVQAIENTRQHIRELGDRLLALQKQCLARGTRDVVERAREVLRETASDVLSESDKFS